MAWASADITTDELDGFNKDCPLLIGKNALSASVIAAQCFDPTSSIVTTGADRTDEFAPIERLYDGHLDLPCKLSQHHAYTLTLASHLLLIKLSTPITFDTAIFTGHNLASGRFSALGLRVGDNDNLGISPTEILDAGVVDTTGFTTDARYVDTKLYTAGGQTDPRVLSNVERLGVSFTQDSDELTAPELGELVLGKRRQLQHHPEFTWNDGDYVSTTADLETASGNSIRYSLNRGQAIRSAVLTLTGAAEIAAVEAWWIDCNYGKDPFWWIETPKSNPRAFYMRATQASLDFPQSMGAAARTLTLEMVEQRPFLAWEEDLF